MPESHIIAVTSAMRLDLLLVQEWESLGRQQIQQMITHGNILVNDIPARKVAQWVNEGDNVSVLLPLPAAIPHQPVDNQITVIFEDDQLLVVDKPAGMVVKTSNRKQQTSLASILTTLRSTLANVGGVGHAGLITLLEEEASGLVLVAKHEQAYSNLRKSLKRQRIQYSFTGMVEGRLRGEGVIAEPIGNARHERERQQVSREGRPAVTHYRAQRQFKDAAQDYTLLLITPETSRRHQIRVHLAWYGFPLVGDKIYGSRHQRMLFDRVFLHLGVLEFPNPQNDETMRVESSLPRELQSIITYFVNPRP
jgi:23S rRNA pseudouridine1911/1915/1917 synthase